MTKSTTIGAFLVASVFATACSTKTGSTVDVSGKVYQERSTTPLAAQVCATVGSQCAQTASDGSFMLNALASSPNSPPVLVARATGYASQYTRVDPQAPQVTMYLRAVDSIATITLPSSGSPPVTLQVNHTIRNSLDGNAETEAMTLSIPPQAMVGGDGNLVAGAANVTLTFYPADLASQAVMPAPLLAENGAVGTKDLMSYGMGQIEVTQGNQILQVASGQRLTWTVTMPTVLQQFMKPPLNAFPKLYSLNTNTALWHEEGTMADGSLTYDANTGVFSASLAHLSNWNVDNDEPASMGGCVTGNVINPCGVPMPNFPVTVWFNSIEQIKDWHTTSDSTGTFCINTPQTAYAVQAGIQNTVFWLSGRDTADTTTCDPLPAAALGQCLTCNPADEALFYSFCSYCQINGFPGEFSGSPTGEPQYNYQSRCPPPQATVGIAPGQFCPGACSNVGTLVVHDPNNCTLTFPPMGTVPTNPCLNGTGKQYGESCDPTTDVCCPQSNLTCADYLCVPR